jgi:hypothetical protein
MTKKQDLRYKIGSYVKINDSRNVYGKIVSIDRRPGTVLRLDPSKDFYYYKIENLNGLNNHFYCADDHDVNEVSYDEILTIQIINS